MEKKVPIEDICKVLEIPISSWTLQEEMSVDQAKVALEDFKDIVKKQRKILAKKYHPDMPRGDEIKMKVVNAMVDIVIKLEITILKQRTQLKPTNFRFYGKSNDGPFSNNYSTASFFRFR